MKWLTLIPAVAFLALVTWWGTTVAAWFVVVPLALSATIAITSYVIARRRIRDASR